MNLGSWSARFGHLNLMIDVIPGDALSEPALIETLTVADAKSYELAEDDLRSAYPWVPVPE